jgi:intermediate cleaving peptidase 55
VTPGISAFEYAQRRARLADKLPAHSIAILSASETKYRSGAVFYKYYQDADFAYITGFLEPEAVAVIQKNLTDEEPIFHLYVRPKNAKAELWEGARSGIQAAQDVFNGDEVGDVANVRSILNDLIGGAKHVYTDIPTTLPDQRTSFNGRYLNGLAHWKVEGLPKLLRESKEVTLHPLRRTMNELRVVKSPAEIDNMLRAGVASGKAFNKVMASGFTKETDLQTSLEYEILRAGCEGMAYVPVVGSGRNALSIHYVRNDDVIRDQHLVLVDGGGQYGGYVTDITRTWSAAAPGRWSQAQKDLYSAVLEPQKTLVAKCSASQKLSLDDLHSEAENLLKQNFKALGFDVSGDAMNSLFPHHVSHHVGLDVHDAPGYSRKERLVPGNCITIEPGVYVSESDRWPTHFRGMGIRIEDSICIQEDGPLVLTGEAIKEVSIPNGDRG